MRIKTFMTVLIACLAVWGRAAAQNTCELEKIHIVSEGEGVSADFSSVDTSTCALGIETTVHVEASQGVITTADHCGHGGNPMSAATTTQTNVVAILVGVYDRCLATQLLSVTGTGEADELHVNNNFKTASLRAAFDGVDEFDQTVSIAIDLVWTGVGPKERVLDHDSENQGVFRFHYTSSGTIRDGVAAGSVVVDGTDETPDPSTQGTIERDTFHNFVVYR